MTDYKKLAQADRDTLLHPFTNLKDFSEGKLGDPRIVTGGKGIYIKDQTGREIIDGFAGLYCVNVGYGRNEIADAIYEQAKKLQFFHTYAAHSNEPIIELTDRIIKMAPGDMERIFWGMSGSDANETQAKLVWYYNNILGRPEKKKIIARERGYHGCSVFSGSLTGLSFYHEMFDIPVQYNVLRTGAPYYYRCHEDGESELAFSERRARELEELILEEGPDTIGAFIAEPVLGTGGICPPPEGYWEKIQAVLKKYDILLIADEVVTGFGRAGDMFGSAKYGMEPDLITVAKGLTSAAQPLSGAIVSKKVADVFKKGSDIIGAFSHGYTYSGHPLGAAAALATLDIVEGEDLPGNARDTGGYMQEQLRDAFADHPLVGDVRGVGLMAAIEFMADKDDRAMFDADLKVGARMSAACLDEGLILRAMPHGDMLGVSPPLVINRAEVDELVGRTRRAIDKVTKELTAENLWKAA